MQILIRSPPPPPPPIKICKLSNSKYLELEYLMRCGLPVILLLREAVVTCNIISSMNRDKRHAMRITSMFFANQKCAAELHQTDNTSFKQIIYGLLREKKQFSLKYRIFTNKSEYLQVPYIKVHYSDSLKLLLRDR